MRQFGLDWNAPHITSPVGWTFARLWKSIFITNLMSEFETSSSSTICNNTASTFVLSKAGIPQKNSANWWTSKVDGKALAEVKIQRLLIHLIIGLTRNFQTNLMIIKS
jgi:hypothetical protein